MHGALPLDRKDAAWVEQNYLFDNLVVVTTTQSSVTTDNSQEDCLYWSDLYQRRVHILNPQPLVDTKQYLQ